ncbi:MAG: MFS transporter [Coxiellaceae bacterium]|nr:MFS transporter [Coxiellaceae bacterium]
MMLLLAMGLMMFMINLDFTIINVALPDIAIELNMSLATMQWTINAYLLGGATLMVLCGRLADLYGKRRIFFLGTTVFVLASLASGLAVNAPMLVISRFLQGIGIALDLPVLYAIPLTVLPKQKHGFAAGFIGMTVALGMLVGPSVGGFICQYFSWRWIFFINIPLAIIALVLARITCPKDNTAHLDGFKDYYGALLLFIAVTSLIMLNTEIQHWTHNGKLFYIFSVLFILSFIHFLRLEKKHKAPLIDLSLFKIRLFNVLNGVRLLFQFILCSFLLFPAIMLKNMWGFSSLKTGITLLAMTCAMAIVSPITGKLLDHIGAKILLLIALSLSIISCVIMITLDAQPSLTTIIIALILFGAAAGIVTSACPKTMLQAISLDKKTVATGIFLSLTVLGSALGVSISGSVLALISDASLWHQLPQAMQHLTAQQSQHLELIANGARPLSQAIQHQSQLANAYFFGFKMISVLWLILSIACGLLIWGCLPRHVTATDQD